MHPLIVFAAILLLLIAALSVVGGIIWASKTIGEFLAAQDAEGWQE